MLIGGMVGKIAGLQNKERIVSRTRVFISFDYDHDAALKEFLIGQSKNPDSPFQIENWSINAPVSGDWKQRARERIRRSDQVVIICGEHTHTATGVATELQIAQEEGKPYFLLNGYRDRTCTKPRPARRGDKIYKWTWDNLKALVGGAR